MANEVVIVGGGLAGLAAASLLGPAGISTTVLEARKLLGGRATSFIDQKTGELVDNCQHVSMGCCTSLADFLLRVGIDDLLETHQELLFVDEKNHTSTIRADRWPAPFHLLPSLARLTFLSWTEKLRVSWGMVALMRGWGVRPCQSARDWLLRHGQTTRTMERFWALVLTSALNESLDRIEMAYARQVFVEGFLMNASAMNVELPHVSLAELYGERLEGWLEKMGARVRRLTTAESIVAGPEGVQGVRLRGGETLPADNIVLAVPFHRLESFLSPEMIAADPSLQLVRSLESSPITSVHLWFDRPVIHERHLVVVGRTVQWLFRRSDRDEGYVQAVISASRDLDELGNEGTLEQILAEVREILPDSRQAELKHARVVTERRATFSVFPGVDLFRPSQETRIPGLWLAGDYTRTGWPATMEGAVRSGYLAAQGILRRLGRPPGELPRSISSTGWARLLIRNLPWSL